MSAKPAEQRQRGSFFPHVKEEIQGLYQFVRGRIAYHESIGDLTPGEVAPEDIVGSVLLHAYGEFASRSATEGAKEPREHAIGHRQVVTLQRKSLEVSDVYHI
jgi:hypothetical protein